MPSGHSPSLERAALVQEMPVPGDELTLDKDQYTKDEVAALVAERNRALEANRNETLNELKSLRQRAKSYEGIDAEEYKTLKAERERTLAEQEKAEAKRLEEAGNWKAREEQLVKKYESQLVDEQAKTGRVNTFLERSLKDAAAITELAKHSDSTTLLLPHVLKQMKVVEEDGEYVARIVDARGNVRIGKGQGSAPMTLAELMDEMKQDKEYASAFRGSGSSGGGASRSSVSGGTTSTIAADDGQKFLQNLKGISSGDIKVALTQ